MESLRGSYSRLSLLFMTTVLMMSCRPSSWNKLLPLTQDLGTNRGYRIARTAIHLHSPISYDACDPGNSNCLADLRAALCTNHVDFAFLTDHPDNMAKTAFTELHLSATGDQTLTDSGSTIGNQITCSDGHKIMIMAGYEDQLMPIGMTKHLDPDTSVRAGLYIGNSADLVLRLKNEANAIVFVPHTESRTNEFLKTLGMDGIEVYNLHANINPKIRKEYLGFDLFSGLLDLTVYWADPYGTQQPDLAFMSFLNVSPLYAQKWAYLISQNLHVIGIAGNDSHQNFFPGTAGDGDRVDSHRRLLRWVTNYFLLKEMTLTDIKDAVRKARGWMVFEGLGTPSGMDFYAKNSTTTAETGETLTLQTTKTSIHVELPRLHSNSPQQGSNPVIIIRLKRITSSGEEQIIATSSNASLDYNVTDTGAYRAEVSIIPLHLYSFMGFKSQKARSEMPWITTNHIYIQ